MHGVGFPEHICTETAFHLEIEDCFGKTIQMLRIINFIAASSINILNLLAQ